MSNRSSDFDSSLKCPWNDGGMYSEQHLADVKHKIAARRRRANTQEPDHNIPGEPADFVRIVQVLAVPEKIALALTLVVILLVVVSTTGKLFSLCVNHDQGVQLLAEKIYVDYENTVSAWFASSALLFSAILLITIAVARKCGGHGDVIPWASLAFIFLCLSIDEAVGFHNIFAEMPYSQEVGTLSYVLAGVLPELVLVIFVAVLYLRFVIRLEPRFRGLFVLAATTVVVGAVIFELVSSLTLSQFGRDSTAYIVSVTAEEGLEMLGVVIFIYALMSYLASYVGQVRVKVVDRAALP